MRVIDVDVLMKFMDAHRISKFEMTRETLGKLDGVDVAPVRRGNWVRPQPDGMGYCSECCKDMPSFLSDWNWTPFETRYCPHCGAKMDMEETDE